MESGIVLIYLLDTVLLFESRYNYAHVGSKFMYIIMVIIVGVLKNDNLLLYGSQLGV